MTAEENLWSSQIQFYKSQVESQKKITKDILRTILNKIPRDDLIEILIKKKIIQRDWEKNGVKYKIKNG